MHTFISLSLSLAVTAYSPAMIALHDLMKSQLNLTKTLIEQSRCLSESILSGNSPNYHYTSVDDTKQVMIFRTN